MICPKCWLMMTPLSMEEEDIVYWCQDCQQYNEE